MGLIKTIVLTLFMMIGLICHAEAAWQGPNNIVNMGWGNQPGQVAITYGDTEDDFPHVFKVDKSGNIVIGDSGNTRLQLFSAAGELTKIINSVGFPLGTTGWPLQWELLRDARIFAKRGEKYQIYDYQGNLVNQFNGVAAYIDEIVVLPDDSIVAYKSDIKTYYLYSPTGQLVKTYTERPLELGKVTEKPVGSTKVKITVIYPDKTYPLILAGPYEKYQRDASGKLNAISGKLVKKFNECGKELGSLVLPVDQSRVVSPGGRGSDKVTALIEEYGQPVIAPNGDVYTWKRTPTTYSILKWTWADDPSAPANAPDTPLNLTARTASTGIDIFWKPPYQDPGCVTGYEISRSTTAGSGYSSVGTVGKGVYKFTDTTASAGTTYYYTVRAMAGTEYSTYSNEANGTK
jgi:hypothetical protein